MPLNRFSLRRALLSTTLIAIGVAALPLAHQIRDIENGFADALKILCVACFFGLPGAGVGLLFGRPVVGSILGLSVGVLLINWPFRYVN